MSCGEGEEGKGLCKDVKTIHRLLYPYCPVPIHTL